MDVTKPYEVIWFGDVDGPKPYKFIGSGGRNFANTGIFQNLYWETVKNNNFGIRPTWFAMPVGTPSFEVCPLLQTVRAVIGTFGGAVSARFSSALGWDAGRAAPAWYMCAARSAYMYV